MASTNWGEVIQEAEASGGAVSYDRLPDGDYDLIVTKAETKQTQAGKTMYKIESTVNGGQHNGRKVWDNLVVSPESGRAMSFFFQKMAALGLGMEYFKTNPSDDAITGALVNRQFRAKLKQASYGDGNSNEIDRYYAPRTGGQAPGAPAPAQGAPAPAPQQGYGAPAPAPQQYQQAPPAPAPQQYAQQAPAPAQAPQQGQYDPNAYQQPGQAPQGQYGAPAAPTPAPAPAAGPPQQGSPWETQGGQNPALPPAPPTPF